MSGDAITPLKKSSRNTSPVPLDDEYIEPLTFTLESLGLQPVGTVPPPKPPAQKPIQMLNLHGIATRTRKPRRFFYDHDVINDGKPLVASPLSCKAAVESENEIVSSPKNAPTKVLKKRKGSASRYARSDDKKEVPEISDPTCSTSGAISAKSSITSTQSGSLSTAVTSADRIIGERIGMRLRNLLKLPKAHQWVIYEWFYSLVDRPLFYGENDFQSCLSESFPNLHTRQLTRAEWQTVRSLIGKPRRCSQAFFEEERRELERKRQKLRYMQTCESGDLNDLNFVRDLPEKIPLPLPVGTKVSARLRSPQNGIFSGIVDAFDAVTFSYRVTFDHIALGIHSIPDFEIVSENFHEMLTLQSIRNDYSQNDNQLGQETKNPANELETINGHSPEVIEMIVRLKRELKIKRSKLDRLSSMNDEGAKRLMQLALQHNSSDFFKDEDGSTSHLSEEFQRRYASVVITMEHLNRDIHNHLNKMLYSSNLICEPESPLNLREKYQETAMIAVERNNDDTIKDQNLLSLITKLTTMMLVASHANKDGDMEQVTKEMNDCIEDIKTSICSANHKTLDNEVLIHLNKIRCAIDQKMQGASTSANISKDLNK